jgi:hypothetical protein
MKTMNKQTITLVNQLRIELSISYSELDNEVNHYLLQLHNGEISKDEYKYFTNPFYNEMKKLKDIGRKLKEFRMTYSEKSK